jgi:uncharacterized transporter YbjL
MNRFILSFLFFAAAFSLAAQQAAEPQMADSLREDGKIYVVISVIALIFIALVLFIVFVERKIKKLEQRLNKQKN